MGGAPSPDRLMPRLRQNDPSTRIDDLAFLAHELSPLCFLGAAAALFLVGGLSKIDDRARELLFSSGAAALGAASAGSFQRQQRRVPGDYAPVEREPIRPENPD